MYKGLIQKLLESTVWIAAGHCRAGMAHTDEKLLPAFQNALTHSLYVKFQKLHIVLECVVKFGRWIAGNLFLM